MIIVTLVILASVFSIANPSGKTNRTFTDTLEAERNFYMQQVLNSIKGKEKLNADSVFKDLKTFKGVKNFTAEHFLLMMNIGWGKGLGISCTYCHNPGNWASEEKPQKEIARQMYGLRRIINDNLKQINNLHDNPARVNCFTCHRGKILPVEDE